MEKGQKVIVNVSEDVARRLGISGAIKGLPGVIDGHYTNGIDGHYVIVNGRIIGVADKYNTLTPDE